MMFKTLKVKNKIEKLLTDQHGIGLVETLIAISLAVVVVTSLISLAVYALRNSRQSSYTAQATQIAQNQLELLRAYRDNTDWASFIALGNSGAAGRCFSASGLSAISTICNGAPSVGCSYPISSPNIGGLPNNTPNNTTSPFTYSMLLANVSGTYRAGVVVHWSIGGKNQCIYNYTDFTNWRGK